MKLNCWLLPFFLAFPSICLAELKEENLLQNLPDGYKVALQLKGGVVGMTTMLPENETLTNFTESIGTQIFFGERNYTADKVQAQIAKSWSGTKCGDGEATKISEGEENGYVFSIWTQTCNLNPFTKKPESKLIKSIKGNDNFYVIQKTFNFHPSKEQITQWMQYFRSVTVCDPRLAAHSCSKPDQIGK